VQTVEASDLVQVLSPRPETRPTCESGNTAVDTHRRFNCLHLRRVAALSTNARAAQLCGHSPRDVPPPLVDACPPCKRARVGHAWGAIVLASALLQREQVALLLVVACV